MRLTFFSFLTLLLGLSCAKDSVQPQLELTGCRHLNNLTVEQHTAAIIGDWRLISLTFGGFGSTGETLTEEDIITLNSITYFEDGTYRDFDEDVGAEGTWTVVPDTLTDGSIGSRLVLEGNVLLERFTDVCEGGLAFYNYIPADGNSGVYRKQ